MAVPDPSSADSDLVGRIAAETGVSPRTVRRCLSGVEARYGATRRRMEEIRAAAARLGYQPNPAARALRRGSFHNVLLVSAAGPLQSFLQRDLVAAVGRRLGEQGMRLGLARADEQEAGDPEALRRLLAAHGADGLLLDYIDRVPAGFMQAALARLRVPAVWINRDLPHDAVVFADRDGMAAVAAALAMRGRRRIAYLDLSHEPGDAEAHYSARARHEGWRAARRVMGADDPCLVRLVPAEGRLAAVRAWLSTLPAPPDAVCAYCADHAAIAQHALALAGAPAADLGIVDEAPWVLGAPAVCTRLPFDEMGRAAVDLLLAKVDDPQARRPQTVIAGSLIVPPG